MHRATPRFSTVSVRAVTLAVALAFALAACGGGPTVEADLAGSWTGTWVSDNDATGGVSAVFTQTGGVLSGTVNITGSPCISNGRIEGSVTGTNVAFGAVSGQDTINFTSQLGDDTMVGTYAVPSGACAGDTGNFELNRVN